MFITKNFETVPMNVSQLFINILKHFFRYIKVFGLLQPTIYIFFLNKKKPILGGLTCFLISECCATVGYQGIFPFFLSNMRLDWWHISH